MPTILKTTRMTEGQYDKASKAGKRFLANAEQHREDVIGRYRLRTGKGSSIRIAKPQQRMVMRGGKCTAWKKVR